MADQVTIDYTLKAHGNEPPVSVSLTLTLGAYNSHNKSSSVTGLTGTYTVAGKSPEPVTLVKPGHLGQNDNRVYPTSTYILDRHGITFDYANPGPHSPHRFQRVNLFLRGKTFQQFSNYQDRNATLTSSVTSTASAAPAVAHFAAVAAATQCFASGTLIRTARGDVAVEALAIGDRVVTASGALRPIIWLGHRTLDLHRHPGRAEVAPVRIAAGAFGPGLPVRDLLLSPGHPVLVGADADHEAGHLVPIMCLINGTTIDRVAMEAVTYWHVELDAHDILLADGLPAESYIEWGDRAFFYAAAESILASPDLIAPGAAGRCRPVAIDGPVVEAERDRLDAVFAARLTEACLWPDRSAALDL